MFVRLTGFGEFPVSGKDETSSGFTSSCPVSFSTVLELGSDSVTSEGVVSIDSGGAWPRDERQDREQRTST